MTGKPHYNAAIIQTAWRKHAASRDQATLKQTPTAVDLPTNADAHASDLIKVVAGGANDSVPAMPTTSPTTATETGTKKEAVATPAIETAPVASPVAESIASSSLATLPTASPTTASPTASPTAASPTASPTAASSTAASSTAASPTAVAAVAPTPTTVTTVTDERDAEEATVVTEEKEGKQEDVVVSASVVAETGSKTEEKADISADEIKGSSMVQTPNTMSKSSLKQMWFLVIPVVMSVICVLIFRGQGSGM
eukprot:CAMPEP_0205918992 /NCGR_PEP_ID=MMETSP1325-20131115/10150_1 /ASSEMBLY_ACC=CAM_ASM_000708 /TAXON_ID=236786 /ORGANISM="Florenciella sp., Strain RCC1007" /LENGTH=253 /DNA_ID=CAMNT_0053286569 /DNA_START=33 /DNA_END=791 /DNA_ORIENTATION=-